jgi:hypothetical protein
VATAPKLITTGSRPARHWGCLSAATAAHDAGFVLYRGRPALGPGTPYENAERKSCPGTATYEDRRSYDAVRGAHMG